MAKLTTTDITAVNTNGINQINTNFDAVETAMEKTLSRDGTTPNSMAADLDMDSNNILNLPAAVTSTEPVRKAEFDANNTLLTASVQTIANAASVSAAASASSAFASNVSANASEVSAVASAASAASAANSAAVALGALIPVAEFIEDTVGALIDTTTSVVATYTDATAALTLERAALTGDISAPQNSNTTTLATVNANVGSFGSATQIPSVTVNGKGLVTAASHTNVAIPSTQVTDFIEASQDAVGGMATNSTSVTLTYVDAAATLTAERAALTGDITAPVNSNATTLATVNANIGSFGSATQVGTFTVNGKGLTTAAANATITPAVGSITGLATGISTFLGTPSSANLRAAITDESGSGALLFADSAIGTPTSGTLTNCTGLPTAGLVNDAVTYAKIQNVSATDRILGRSTAGAGDIEEITCTAAARSILDDASVAAIATTLGLGTGDSPQFTAVNIGNASDTTVSRDSAGVIAVEGVALATNIPQNSQSAAYTLVIADAQKHIFHPSADTTARIWTIPANSSVAYPIGTVITFINQNAGGVITISITTDTMRLAGPGTTGSRTLAANGMATALKVTSTEWIISGTGLT